MASRAPFTADKMSKCFKIGSFPSELQQGFYPDNHSRQRKSNSALECLQTF